MSLSEVTSLTNLEKFDTTWVHSTLQLSIELLLVESTRLKTVSIKDTLEDFIELIFSGQKRLASRMEKVRGDLWKLEKSQGRLQRMLSGDTVKDTTEDATEDTDNDVDTNED